MTATAESLLKELVRNQRGNIAIMSAMLMLPVILGIGVAIDFSSLHRAKSDLQQLADNSALASAKELAIVNKSTDNSYEVAKHNI